MDIKQFDNSVHEVRYCKMPLFSRKFSDLLEGIRENEFNGGEYLLKIDTLPEDSKNKLHDFHINYGGETESSLENLMTGMNSEERDIALTIADNSRKNNWVYHAEIDITLGNSSLIYRMKVAKFKAVLEFAKKRKEDLGELDKKGKENLKILKKEINYFHRRAIALTPIDIVAKTLDSIDRHFHKNRYDQVS